MDELETKVNELTGSEKYKEAIKYLYRQLDSKEGKDQSKDRAQIHELLGRVYNVKGDFDRALKCVVKACDEYHAIDGVYKYVDSFLIDGDHHLKDGDFINAQTIYKGGLLFFPDNEALKHGLKNAEVMEERNAALNASKLIQEEEQQKKKGGPKINEGKLIQKKKGSSNRGKEKVIEVEKQENLIREEKQKKLIQEEPLEKKGVNSGGKEVKRMDQEDIHNQCEDNVHSSDSTTFTVSSKITLLANSCQGTLESDSNDPVPKSFLTPTNFQADNFNVLHALCSYDINLLNVENMIKDCNKTALLLVTEPVKTLEGFFNNELKKISSSGKVTRKLWWEHIALMFRQIFRDYSRGLLFLFSSSSGFCGDLSFNLYVTNEGKGKILPSLKSKVNQGLRRLQRQDVADWVNQMVKVISLPFKKAVKVNEDELEIPLELEKLLRCEYCIKHKNSPNVSAQFLVDHPFFWTKKERVNFIIKLKALLKIYPSDHFLSTMDKLEAYRGYKERLFGVYKAIFAKGEFDIEKPSSPGTYRVRKYRGSKDLVRFCGSVYTHCNDGEYKSIRGNKVLSVDNVHDDLRILFPELYADIYNAIGSCLSFWRWRISPKLIMDISTYQVKNGGRVVESDF